MTLTLPLYTQDQGYPPWLMRRQMASLVSAGVVNLVTDFLVTPGSGLQVNVSAGEAYVQQTIETTETSSADKGVYYAYNDGPVNPSNTITAPLVNPRIDQVVLRVYDIVEQGIGGASRAQPEWVLGAETAGANLTNLNGAASSLPANSLRLAYVLQTVGEGSISSGNILRAAPFAQSLLAPQSTIWTPLTFPAGFAASTPVPQARRIVDEIQLRGTVRNTSAGTLSPGSPFAIVPAGMLPVQVSRGVMHMAVVPGVLNDAFVDTSGNVNTGVSISMPTTSDVASLDGFIYPLN